MLTNEVLINYTWTGQNNKKRFNKYDALLKCVLDSVRATHKNYTNHDMEGFFKDFIKHAANRVKRKQ